MHQNPTWVATSSSANQECIRILWNSTVRCRVHKSPPLVPTLSQINLVYVLPSYSFKIQFNIILKRVSNPGQGQEIILFSKAPTAALEHIDPPI
jgi:hypothetical protein